MATCSRPRNCVFVGVSALTFHGVGHQKFHVFRHIRIEITAAVGHQKTVRMALRRVHASAYKRVFSMGFYIFLKGEYVVAELLQS